MTEMKLSNIWRLVAMTALVTVCLMTGTVAVQFTAAIVGAMYALAFVFEVSP